MSHLHCLRCNSYLTPTGREFGICADCWTPEDDEDICTECHGYVEPHTGGVCEDCKAEQEADA